MSWSQAGLRPLRTCVPVVTARSGKLHVRPGRHGQVPQQPRSTPSNVESRFVLEAKGGCVFGFVSRGAFSRTVTLKAWLMGARTRRSPAGSGPRTASVRLPKPSPGSAARLGLGLDTCDSAACRFGLYTDCRCCFAYTAQLESAAREKAPDPWGRHHATVDGTAFPQTPFLLTLMTHDS